MRLRTAVLAAIAAMPLIGVATLPAQPVLAQDGGAEEEGAEEGAAEEPTGPQAEPPISFVDRRSMTEIQLPRNFKAEKFTETNGRLAHWVWPFHDTAVAGVSIFRRDDYMRAPLLRHAMLGLREPVEGTLREGKGWVEACGIEQDRIAVYERYIESGGIVFVAQFVCHKSSLEEFKEVFLPALESFHVTGEVRPNELPDGWEDMKVKSYVLWTEADEDNQDDAEDMVERLIDMKKFADKALDGDPYYDHPPLVKIIQSGTLFEKIAVENIGQKPDNAMYDPRGRALLVKWMSRRTQGFDHDFEQWAAAQLVSEHYGGSLPFWLSGGLRMYVLYGFQDGGKPQKPDKDRMTRLKGTIALAKLRLDKWFTTKLQDVPDSNQGFAEVWGWHWFFRHARQGKKYRKTYEKCLDTLLETGDPGKAHAVWEGTDFEEMFADFKKWGDSI